MLTFVTLLPLILPNQCLLSSCPQCQSCSHNGPSALDCDRGSLWLYSVSFVFSNHLACSNVYNITMTTWMMMAVRHPWKMSTLQQHVHASMETIPHNTITGGWVGKQVSCYLAISRQHQQPYFVHKSLPPSCTATLMAISGSKDIGMMQAAIALTS